MVKTIYQRSAFLPLIGYTLVLVGYVLLGRLGWMEAAGGALVGWGLFLLKTNRNKSVPLDGLGRGWKSTRTRR